MMKISDLLTGKDSQEKAHIKSERIAALPLQGKFNDKGVEVNIISINEIDGGIEVFAQAYNGKKQLGFGADGSVDIERFRIYSPPILVDDPNGDVVREWKDERTGEHREIRLREDPVEALKQTLLRVVSIVGKSKGNIIEGKIGNTTSVFRPDPNVETNTFDGRVGNSNASWTTCRDATTGAYVTGDTATIITALSQLEGGVYYIIRSIHLYNTGPTIPSGDVISSATITLTCDNIFDGAGGAQGYAVVTGAATPASNTAIANADFNDAGGTAHSDNIDLTGWTAGTTKVFTLNADGIANIAKGSGVSKFGFRDGYDFENVAVGSGLQSSVDVRSADYAGTSSDPLLTVEHAAAASRSRLLLLGVG